MAGHSKWSTIKRKKGALDARRGKIFTKVIHEIIVAVREGKSADADSNPRLRLALEKAKGVNMPADTIARAIRRATGEEQGEQKEELIYEGFAPGGVAVIVEVLTDNRNRTVGEIRHCFVKCGGSLGESGSVMWMFRRKGVFHLPKASGSEEDVMERAISAGAEDVRHSEEVWEILCDPSAFTQVRERLGEEVELAELQYVAESLIEPGEAESERVLRLLEMLDDLDDVMNVYTNVQ